ncbi:PDK repeat-containing protein [Bernardetia litoralis DSM 6794]|uniref:PDK repeat-containing protein n=2 Tax=Bernardetia litoralis TaxID=999 RepID=I4AIU6_BERLS|nr:PDK repeat-containing protein [Bernardetia litoralis DSM 6794]
MKINFLPTFLLYVILINSFVLFSYSDAFSQRSCHTSETEYYLNNKDKIAGSEAFEKKLNGYIIQRREALKNNPLLHKVQKTEATYRIPIIVHVVHNGEAIGEGSNISAAQIYGQIEVLNEDFNFTNPDKDETLDIFKDVAANPSIEFVLATVDQNGNPLAEVGIHRSKGCLKQWDSATFDTYAKPVTVWDTNNYFNIWVTNLRVGAYGYAQFPILSDLDGIRNENKAANTDGVVVNYRNFGSIEKTSTIQALIEAAPLNLGRTLTHEVGHFFGLLHTWGDENLSCASDDFCTDTPNTSTRQRGCNLNEDACESGQIVMTQNFMEYTDDACMTLFTEDQTERIQAVLAISPRRKELLTSKTADPITNKLFANFSSNQRVTKNGKIKFTNQSLATGSKQIDTYQWTFTGGTPSTSNEQNPTITYSQEGNFSATLKISSNDGTEDTRQVIIEVIDDNLTALDETLLDFEDRDFEKEGWSFERTDISNWRLFSDGAYSASDFSVYSPNYDYRSCESELTFISPFIRIPTSNVLEISFDVAYSYDINQLSDSLEISYTTDGGDKFVPIWKLGGEELKTAITQTATFNPSPSQWKSHKFYIEIEDDISFMQVKFRNIGANNNNLYLDNLGIRQITNLQAPIIDFDVNYPLILLSETAHFYSKTEYGIDFNWTINGNTNIQATGSTPQILFNQEGIYDVTLQSSNPLDTKEQTQTNAIEVIRGRKINSIDEQNLSNETLNGQPLAGHDGEITVSKAEFFNDFGFANKIHAVDIFFADAALSSLNETFDVVMWSVDADGKPNQELYRQEVLYSLINRDIFERRQFTRVIFEEAQDVPTQFFISVELEYETGNTFSIFTEKKAEGKGWEKKANGDWLSYAANRGQNYSNAISVILSPDEILGTDDDENLSNLIKLYPNPSQGSFSLETQDLRIETIEIYNSIGQIIYQKNISNTFISNFDIQLKQPSNGMYLVKIQTQKGIITQKLIIQN